MFYLEKGKFKHTIFLHENYYDMYPTESLTKVFDITEWDLNKVYLDKAKISFYKFRKCWVRGALEHNEVFTIHIKQ